MLKLLILLVIVCAIVGWFLCGKEPYDTGFK